MDARHSLRRLPDRHVAQLYGISTPVVHNWGERWPVANWTDISVRHILRCSRYPCAHHTSSCTRMSRRKRLSFLGQLTRTSARLGKLLRLLTDNGLLFRAKSFSRVGTDVKLSVPLPSPAGSKPTIRWNASSSRHSANEPTASSTKPRSSRIAAIGFDCTTIRSKYRNKFLM